MSRFIQSLIFLTGLVFFGVGQVWLWNTDNRLVPYLLTSIILLLMAIYLQGSRCQK